MHSIQLTTQRILQEKNCLTLFLLNVWQNFYDCEVLFSETVNTPANISLLLYVMSVQKIFTLSEIFFLKYHLKILKLIYHFDKSTN